MIFSKRAFSKPTACPSGNALSVRSGAGGFAQITEELRDCRCSAKKKHSRWKKPTAAMILYYEIPVMPSWAISMVSIAISDAAALKSGALYFIGHALITCHEAAGDYASSSSVM